MFAQLNTNSSPRHSNASTIWHQFNLPTPTFPVHVVPYAPAKSSLSDPWKYLEVFFSLLLLWNLFLCIFCKNATHTSVPPWNVTACLSCLFDMISPSFQFTEHVFCTFLMSWCQPCVIIMYIMDCRSLRLTVNYLFLFIRSSKIH